MSSSRDKRTVFDPQNTLVTDYIDFADSFGNYKSASITCNNGNDDYTLALPGDNPVGTSTDKGFIDTRMPHANDQVLVATPRVKTDSTGKLVPVEPGIFDCRFMGLSSGFYSDFVPITGVTTTRPRLVSRGLLSVSMCRTCGLRSVTL